jgi:hypothetical protein
LTISRDRLVGFARRAITILSKKNPVWASFTPATGGHRYRRSMLSALLLQAIASVAPPDQKKPLVPNSPTAPHRSLSKASCRIIRLEEASAWSRYA